MKRLPTIIAAIGILLALGWSAQQWSLTRPVRNEWPVDPSLLDTGATLGVLLLGAWLLGRVFALIGVPQLVGYILFGMIAGPSALNVVTRGELEYLALVKDLAIALIALTAGGEMRLGFLRAMASSVIRITVTQMLAVIAVVTIAAACGLWALGWTAGLTLIQTVLVGLLVGTVSIASSPAVLIAVVSELNTGGPMTRLSLAITVCKDLGLVVVFTVVLALASAAIVTDQMGAPSGLGVAASIAMRLLGSLVVGAGAGALTGLIIVRAGTPGPAGLIIACVALSAMCERLHLELLLVSVSAGTMLTNLWPARTERLFDTFLWVSTPVYCVFFAVAGARLDLAAVASVWPMALGLAAIRAAAIWAGTRIGLHLSRERDPWVRNLWTAFIPQAGVTLALAMAMEEAFATVAFGRSVYTLLVAMIAINELIGPILMKIGFTRAGEVGAAGLAPR